MSDWERHQGRDYGNSLRSNIRGRARNWHDTGYHGVIWGAGLCLFGILLLLDHLGYVSVEHLWSFWPLLLIVAGLAHITQSGKRGWGAFLVVLGVFFQLDALRIIHFHWVDLWPLVIIFAGLMMIWGSIESRRVRASVAAGDTSNTMNVSAVFGGVERRITAHDFRGGTVSAVFGGAELDFRGAEMQGDEAVLEVNAVFGGAEIRVPENWRIEVRGQTLFGGYSDSTRGPAPGVVDPPKMKTLILSGTTLFGGVEVKN